MRLTREQIESAKTPSGGFTREQLASWGVAWPPKKGWRRELEGLPVRSDEEIKDIEMQLVLAEQERQSMRALYLEKSGGHTYGEMKGEN